jgi:hypothetical protein
MRLPGAEAFCSQAAGKHVAVKLIMRLVCLCVQSSMYSVTGSAFQHWLANSEVILPHQDTAQGGASICAEAVMDAARAALESAPEDLGRQHMARHVS